MSELVQHQTQGGRVSRLLGRTATLRDRIAGTAADAQSRVRAAGGDLEASFERHPLTALLIAFGVGIAARHGEPSPWLTVHDSAGTEFSWVPRPNGACAMCLLDIDVPP